MTCMQVVEVKTEDVVAKNTLKKLEAYHNLKVDKRIFKNLELPDPYNDDFGW